MFEAEASIYQSSLPIQEKLERARTEFLDLSARNRLLNIPRMSTAAKTVNVVDERSAKAHRLLVRDSKAFTFVAGSPDRGTSGEANDAEEEDTSAVDFALPEDVEDPLDEHGRAKRHLDTKLQTRMTPKGPQKRLLNLYHDARGPGSVGGLGKEDAPNARDVRVGSASHASAEA